ncbi:hypothetical protein FNF28_05053 [Cafeteria roenbergensis]|uniref:Uncharacterized protein n=1 Tax=Cafeteria roenbergensis TaxID=33653 RepID=A0A5A8DAW4_CAFRO|nr:hypothetical protein FNF28_05053 [Cafeteria roenbergensis]
MLLLVASFVESEDLVPIVDEVLDAAEAFLRDDPKLAFDDTAWLGRRGLTLLLTALFMAVEASRTDDDDASEELARDLVHSASSLATVRGSPGSPSTAGDRLKKASKEDLKWLLGTVLVSVMGLSLASSQAASAASQAQSAEAMMRLAAEQAESVASQAQSAASQAASAASQAQSAKAMMRLAAEQAGDRKERERAAAEVKDDRARHAAVRVHRSAADAFVFAKHAHRDGMATDHLSARSRAMEALRHMEDAYDMAMRETSIRDEPHPTISTHLHPHLKVEALVMWHAVMLYYAASTALHTLDEDTSALMDEEATPTARRRYARDTIEFARSCLAQAEVRARHAEVSVLGMWEKDLLDRIALRQADANSFFAAICDNPDQAAAAYDTHSADMAKAGIEHLRARFDSNHAMALFGVGDDRRAVAKLRSAHAKLLGAAKAAPRDEDGILAARWLEDDAEGGASSEDLVPIVDEVLDAAEAFLRDDPKLAFDDTAWLGRRGLTLLLTALFMAVEASRTDDDDASEELARDLVHSASSLATVRGSPGSPSTAGDVGAFAQLVAKGRPSPSSWRRTAAPSVEFSMLSRARRMKAEADRIRERPPSRRTDGGVIDAPRRERIAALLRVAHKMCPETTSARS